MKIVSVPLVMRYNITGAAKQRSRQRHQTAPKPVENEELFDHLFIKNEPRQRSGNSVTRYLFN